MRIYNLENSAAAHLVEYENTQATRNDKYNKRAAADLRDKIIMVGQMGAAVHTAVAAVAGVQVSLERLGFCQLHHI